MGDAERCGPERHDPEKHGPKRHDPERNGRDRHDSERLGTEHREPSRRVEDRVRLELTHRTSAGARIVRNLYPLYLHDLSPFTKTLPNSSGILEPDEGVTSLTEQGEVQTIWWSNPKKLLPFLIRVDEVPAGFAMVASPPFVLGDVDYVVHEFFLVHAFRGRGFGERAATELFRRYPGRWGLQILDGNERASWFWRKVISSVAGEFEDTRAPMWNDADGALCQTMRFESGTRGLGSS